MRMQDGLYYFYLLVEDSAPYQDAKEYCEQLPGFHLPIVITQKQFDTVTSFPEPGPGNWKKKILNTDFMEQCEACNLW